MSKRRGDVRSTGIPLSIRTPMERDFLLRQAQRKSVQKSDPEFLQALQAAARHRPSCK